MYKFCCKINYFQIDLFLLEQIEKKERIDLASMIFTNSYADREGIEKKEHLIKIKTVQVKNGAELFWREKKTLPDRP